MCCHVNIFRRLTVVKVHVRPCITVVPEKGFEMMYVSGVRSMRVCVCGVCMVSPATIIGSVNTSSVCRFFSSSYFLFVLFFLSPLLFNLPLFFSSIRHLQLEDYSQTGTVCYVPPLTLPPPPPPPPLLPPSSSTSSIVTSSARATTASTLPWAAASLYLQH